MSVNMGAEFKEELNKFEDRKPHRVLNWDKKDGTWKTLQAKEYPRAMSAGIAAAMVRAACKHRKAQGTTDIEEAAKTFAALSAAASTHP